MSKRSPYIEIETQWGTLSSGRGHRRCKVMAREVTLPGYEKHQFYAFKTIKGTSRRGDEEAATASDQYSDRWTIVEKLTGLAVITHWPGLKRAAQEAAKKMDKRGGVKALNRELAMKLISRREKDDAET